MILNKYQKVNKGETGDSGVSTENDVLDVFSLNVFDQIDESKLKQMIDFSEGQKSYRK